MKVALHGGMKELIEKHADAVLAGIGLLFMAVVLSNPLRVLDFLTGMGAIWLIAASIAVTVGKWACRY